MFQTDKKYISLDHREYSYAGVVQPKIGKKITKYEEIIKYQDLFDTWLEPMQKDLEILAQGYGTFKGTNTIKFITLNKFKNIPTYRTVTYACIVCDYIPQK